MTTKTVTPAELLASPDKATMAAIEAAQADLQRQIAADHAEWESIAKRGSTMGAKRRALVEAGDVDAIIKNDATAEVLESKISIAQDQRRALGDLSKVVFARESVDKLPKEYVALTATLEHIAQLGAEVLAEWQQVGAALETIEQMRRALDDDAPAPDDALAVALQAAWAGATPPWPSNTAHDPGVRGTVARTLGLNAFSEDPHHTQVRAAA